jgi:hypothetical protein
MTRTGLVIAVIAIIAAAPAASAQNGANNEDGRFTFHRADGNYLRLDGRSGQVSTCMRRSAGWQCQTAPDERAALEAEIARLQTDNASLKKELLSRNLPLPAGVKSDPPARREEPRAQLPSDAELNRVMAFMEKVWKRMVEMIVATQKDMMKQP